MRSSSKARFKAKLYQEQNGLCCYCAREFAIEQMTFEHIVPQSLGGTWAQKNLKLSCSPCNNARGNAHPRQLWRPGMNPSDWRKVENADGSPKFPWMIDDTTRIYL